MATNITIAKLNTLVTANAVQFMSELNKAHSHAEHIGEGIKKSLELVGIGLSAAGAVEFGKSILEMGEHITDLSIEAGMSAESFQVLSNKAVESGVTMEMVAKGAESLRNKLQEAAGGNQEVRNELDKLHLSFAGLQSLKPELQWEAIARAVEESTNKQEALNIVSDLYGKKIGPKLREVLESLASGTGFAGLAASMEKLGLSNDQIKSLDEAGDALGRLWTRMKVFGAKSALGIRDIITEDINGIANIKGGRGTLGDSVKSIWDRLGFGDGSSARGGSPLTQDDPAIKAMLASNASKKLGEQMAKGAADYAKAHPWDSIKVENAQDAKVKSMLGEFFGPIDEKEKAIRAGVIQTSFPTGPNDRNTRIGLLSDGSKNMADENKKQTDLLKGVVNELKDLNRKAFGAGTTYQ